MNKTLYVLACTLCTLLALPAAAQVPSYVPTDGLVGWWPFNGNANDESGNGNDGVVNGATLTEDRFGIANVAYGFDGINDFISIQDAASLSLNGDFTISAWKLEDPSSSNGYHSIVTKRLVGDWSYNLAISKIPGGSNQEEDKLFTGRRNNGGAQTQYRFSNATTQDNVWQHVLVSVENDIIRFYVNGLDAGYVESFGNTFSIPMQNQLVGLTIGDCNCNNNEEMQGSLDDIAIYNRALTESEIQSLYTGQCPTASANCTSLPSNLQQGLVGYWPFCGNANDESGNGNDGVVNGATLTEDRFGNANAAYEFSNQSIIEVAHNPSLTFNETEEFTVSFWHNKTSESSPQHFMGKRAPGSTIFNWQVACASNETSFGTGIGPGQYNGAIYNVGQPSNTWQHLTGTYSNGTWTLYQNGLQVAFNNLAPSADSEAALTFGNSGGFESFNGSLDDIGIWNRALSAQEIQNLFIGTTPPPCVSLPSNLQQGLVGYWPFCGNANDESGNGNDGLVNGATLTEDRFGNAGKAYGFDGVGNYLTANIDSQSVLTVSLWYNSSDPINWYPRLLGIDDIEFLAMRGNNPSYINSNSVGAIGSYPDAIESFPFIPGFNEWHHVVIIHDHNLGIRQLFIDNELKDSNSTTEFLNITSGNVIVGNTLSGTSSDGGAGYFGLIDDIGIWNRALTPEEVQELYTLEACTFTVYDTLTIENIVDIYDTTYINVEVYDTLTVENVINVYDTLTIENIVVVFDTITVENVIDVFDTTTVVETVVLFDTLTVENVIDVYDTTYVTVTDTLIIDIPSGVGGNILNTLLLYPNPTSDQLTISYGNFAAMAGYSLSIFDNGGSAVHQTTITQAQETLDITQWSAGVYQVVVYNAGGVPVETRQIVIQ